MGHLLLGSLALALDGAPSSKLHCRLLEDLQGFLGREQSKKRPIQAATPLVFQGGTGDRSESGGPKDRAAGAVRGPSRRQRVDI